MIKNSILILATLGFAFLAYADDSLFRLYHQVESLRLDCNGYTLGATLTQAQKQSAGYHQIVDAAPGTRKFMDGNLTVVTDDATGRILLLFEKFENVPAQSIHDLVGRLFMEYDAPTASAHDKLVYWAYGAQGKISSRQFQTAKENKKDLNILATVKLNSSLPVLGGKPDEAHGDVYYIISSPPILEQLAQERPLSF